MRLISLGFTGSDDAVTFKKVKKSELYLNLWRKGSYLAI